MAYENADRGVRDSNYEFCTAQSIPTDGAVDRSENIIDLGIAAPHMMGTNPKLKVQITTLIAVASATTSKLYINFMTDAAASTIAGGWTTLAVGVIRLGYNDAKGKVYTAALPVKGPNAYERYLALALQPVGADTLYSAGAIDAWITFE